MIPGIGRLPDQKLADHQTGNGAETATLRLGFLMTARQTGAAGGSFSKCTLECSLN